MRIACHARRTALLSFAAVSLASASVWAGGAPIAIDTIEELQLIGNDAAYPLDGDYILTQDLEARPASTWNSGDGFDPIGSYVADDPAAAFTGTFDGQGYCIWELQIHRETEMSVGLFGCIRGAGEVTNLSLSHANIIGNQNVGGIVGRNEGLVQGCRYRGSVDGGWYVGCIAGRNSGTISQCYSCGYASGTNTFVGGITGRNYGTLVQCHADAAATGNDGVGGLAGSNSSSVVECLATGNVTGGTGTAVGGLLGGNSGTVTRCYWDLQTSEQSTSAGGLGRTSAGLQLEATFTSWDFATAWGIVEGWSYPYLRTISVPYEIDSIEQLQLIGVSYPLDGDYIITQNLNAHATADWDSNRGFRPIGDDASESSKFSGRLFGMGHIIEGLTINRPTEDNVALFGCVTYYGKISGLGIEDCSIAGDFWVGAVTGNCYGEVRACYATGSVSGVNLVGGLLGSASGRVTSCYSAATVTGSGDNVGGLVGSASARFDNCHATGAVMGDAIVGGLVGFSSGNLNRCHATGSTTGTGSYVGGLIGDANGGNLSLCFATGNVTCGNRYAGGLIGVSDAMAAYTYATGSVSGIDFVGGLIGGSYDSVYHSYSNGHVTGTTDTGGLLGDSNTPPSGCYWDTQRSGMATSDGGIGLTTAAMKQQASFASWSFTETWGIDETESYPYLLAIFPIRVTNPSGGEHWAPRTTHEITWTHHPNAGANVKIKLFKGGVFNQWIAGATPNDGAFLWTVPGNLPLAADYTMQIYSATDFSKIDVSDTPFSIAAPAITLTSPNGGEAWAPGSKHTITWTHGAGSGANVKIKLFKGGVFNQWISGGTENDNALVWRLPPDLPLGDDYEIQIYSATDSNCLDFSNAHFSVEEPDIQLLYPNGGDRFLPGDPVAITWTSLPGVGAEVKVKLYKGGAFHSWISGPTPNDGHLQTYIPLDAANGDDYAIQIYSASDFTQVDFSDEDFSVTPNRLRITSPNGGEDRKIDQTCTITWDSDGLVGDDVKLKLFKGGMFHSWISGPTPNDGSFAWAIPGSVTTGADYTIQLYSAVDTTIVDFSDRAFTISEPGIRVITPNGGEAWPAGSTQSITWASAPGTANVKIKLFKGGLFDQWISGPTPNDGLFAWTIPPDAMPATNYKVQIYSATDFARIDNSNANFTITAP